MPRRTGGIHPGRPGRPSWVRGLLQKKPGRNSLPKITHRESAIPAVFWHVYVTCFLTCESTIPASPTMLPKEETGTKLHPLAVDNPKSSANREASALQSTWLRRSFIRPDGVPMRWRGGFSKSSSNLERSVAPGWDHRRRPMTGRGLQSHIFRLRFLTLNRLNITKTRTDSTSMLFSISCALPRGDNFCSDRKAPGFLSKLGACCRITCQDQTTTVNDC